MCESQPVRLSSGSVTAAAAAVAVTTVKAAINTKYRYTYMLCAVPVPFTLCINLCVPQVWHMAWHGAHKAMAHSVTRCDTVHDVA